MALLPVLLTRVPPLVDYPNHLARAVVLWAGAGGPLDGVYQIVWRNLPNLGTDVLLMMLVGALPPDQAGRILIALVLATLKSGMAIYARVALGRWSWWSVAGCLAAYNGTFLFGFLSFNLACGEALLLAALWRSVRPDHPGFASVALAVGAVLLWFTHLGGLLFAIVLCGSAELSSLIRFAPDRQAAVSREAREPELLRNWGGRLARIALPLVPAMLAIALLAATSAFPHAEGASFQSFSTKPYQFYLAFASYDPRWDVPPVVLGILLLVLCAANGRLAADRASLIALAGCVAIFWVAPMGAKGATWIATRFAVMAWLLCFAGVQPLLPDLRTQGFAALAWLAIAARMGCITATWSAEDARTAQVRRVMTCLQPDAILGVYGWPIQGEAAARPHITGATSSLDGHVGAWAVTDGRAIWVSLFALEGQQPITLRPSYRTYTQPTFLTEPLGRITTKAPGGQLQLATDQRFDAILLVHAEGAQLPDIRGVRRVWGFGDARLLDLTGKSLKPSCAPN